MSIHFENNCIKIKDILNDKAVKFLIEAKNSLVAQTTDNTPSDTGDLKRSFINDSYVDNDNLIAYVGSSKQYAIWVEMGTGEYAINKDGRKGGWWIPVGNGADSLPLEDAKKYTWEKYRYGKNGNITFVFTTGMKPKRMLHKAYTIKKSKIQKQANEVFKEMNNI